MDPLILLTDKIDQLLQQYQTSQAENDKLKKEISEQLHAIEQLNAQLQALEQRLEQQAATTTGNAGDNEATRQQLDKIILEIDNLLGTLNE